LNFYIPSYESDLIPYQKTPPVVEDFGEFSHPESDSPIEVWHTRVCDLASQTETWTWFFRHEGETVQVPMRDRWIHKEEFQLLLRLAGFERWEVYGSHECDPFESNGEMADAYWIVSK
jgi:hypothetical protein